MRQKSISPMKYGPNRASLIRRYNTESPQKYQTVQLRAIEIKEFLDPQLTVFP